MGQVLLLSLTAALNPTLVAASTLMMLLPSPVKLMLGYLIGALMMSITVGVVIVFSLEGTDAITTTRSTLSPAATAALGVIALIAAFVLGTGRYQRSTERRRARRDPAKDKRPPRWQQALGRGSPRVTFVVGALLTLPGASYLAGLSRIAKLDYAPAPTVLIIIGFNLIMLALLEVPLVSFVIAPDWTPSAIERAKVWISHRVVKFAVWVLAVAGALLLIKSLVEFIA